MYTAFYGLKKEPFHTTPDPNFLYLSPSHKEAMGAIIYGIERRKGFIAIFGEVGVGKTTIIRAYLEQTSDRKQKTVYILNPVVSFHELLLDIFRSLELVPSGNDTAEMVNQLQEFLIQEYRSESTVVLVIDEAQNMPVKTLEQLRLLSNLETSTDKLIQMVLIGQPELHTVLEHPTLKSLQQRIALRATIQPLNPQESQSYIEHRVALASVTGAPVFTQGAMKTIIREAHGIPRKLNIICDNALITGYGKQRKPVSISEVREVLADMDTSRAPYLWKWAIGVAAAILLAIGTFLLSPLFLPEHTGVSFLNPVEGHNGNPARTSTTGPQDNTELLGGAVVSQPASEPQQEVALPERRVAPETFPTDLSTEEFVESEPGKASRSNRSSVTRSVKEGENLSKIAQEAYGSSQPQYVEWVRRHNPHIVNPDVILPGQKIVLPEFTKE